MSISDMEKEINEFAEKNQKAGYDRGYKQGYKDCEAEIEMTDKSYLDGLNKTWGCIRTFASMNYEERKEIFLSADWTDFVSLSVSEAISKINEYRKIRDAISVGDEVCFPDGSKSVAIFSSDNRIALLTPEGERVTVNPQFVKKTGRHFKQIDEVLRELKE